MKEILEKLTQTFGPSGFESRIRETIREMAAPYADEIHTDALGNLIVRKGTKSENGKRVMIAAHMDEIGLMVTHVNEKGFAYVTAVGGVNPLTCFSGRVLFENGTEGVLYAEMNKMDKVPTMAQLFVDTGATSKEDCPVSVGDICVFVRPFVELRGRWCSKALDNRIGCALAIETLKNVQESPNELVFVFTVQEEVGLRGAKTSAYSVDPDLGIALDVTPASDVPYGIDGNQILGNGPCIKARDNSLIGHPLVNEALREAAKRAGVPYQMEVLRSAGTDAGSIHIVRSGVPTSAVSVPCRYVHSPSEMIEARDCENAVKLLTEFLSKEIKGFEF